MTIPAKATQNLFVGRVMIPEHPKIDYSKAE
jgi:hypothetical protein